MPNPPVNISNYYLYYTTDGSTPAVGSSFESIGATPIGVPVTTTTKAIAAAPGYLPSSVVSAAYIITPQGFTTGPGTTTSVTVTRGSTTGNTATVSVVGTNGFSGVVNLACNVATAMTDLHDFPDCYLNPASVTLSGAAAQTATLTVITTAASGAESRNGILFLDSPGGTALALALFFGGLRRRRGTWVILGLLVLVVSAGMAACGGGGSAFGGGGGVSANPGTTVGNYTITVTGTSAGLSNTVGTVALKVQ